MKIEIKDFLTKLFYLSLSPSYLPLDSKLSTVTAIHKKGSKSEVSNYRPISLTCIVCRILESLIVDKIRTDYKTILFSTN